MSSWLIRAVRLGAAAVLLAALLPRVARADGEIAAGGDRVRWHDGLESYGREAARRLPETRADVARRLGLPDPPGPHEVVIVSGLDAMRAESGGAVPAWAVGLAQSERRRVIIRADLLEEGFGGGLGPTLRHEWVHVAWGSYAGVRRRELPLWAEEGIAEEIGGGLSLDLEVDLDRAVTTHALLDFARLAERFPADAHEAALAYRQARSWIQRFVRERGWEELRGILHDVGAAGATTDFATLVRERSGRGVDEWTIAWRDELSSQASPWFVRWLRDLDAVVITVSAVFSVLVFFLLLRRRRRQMESLGEGDLPRDRDGPAVPEARD